MEMNELMCVCARGSSFCSSKHTRRAWFIEMGISSDIFFVSPLVLRDMHRKREVENERWKSGVIVRISWKLIAKSSLKWTRKFFRGWRRENRKNSIKISRDSISLLLNPFTTATVSSQSMYTDEAKHIRQPIKPSSLLLFTLFCLHLAHSTAKMARC